MLTEEQKAGSSSSSPPPPEAAESGSQDVDDEASDLLAQGKRNLIVGDPPTAVQCLQEACALVAGKYGEMADECGEAYFQYGCALLELGRMETGVLGNALQGVPDESADSDSDDGEEAAASAISVESANKLEDDDGAGPSTEPDTTDGEDAKKSEEKEDADDVSNFQLSWEMLELSRIITRRKEEMESQLKVSVIHLKLGELGLETEQYSQSILDFTTCLEMQKRYLNPESRLIAGTHYNLGMAYSFAQNFEESIQNYSLSKELLDKRLASLEKKLSEAKGEDKEASEEEPLVKDQKEMEELKELLPDVISKLEDAKEMLVQAGVSGGDVAGPSSSSSGFDQPTSSSSGFDQPTSSTAPVQQISVKKSGEKVQDISHLVRKVRKRKPEDGEESSAVDSKRSRQEGEESAPEENGSGDAENGSGDAKMANGNSHVTGDCLPNGDSKLSPEKPSEIKTKKAASEETPAAMETA